MQSARHFGSCVLLGSAALLALAGCAHQQAENPALSEYPSIQGQIESFYNANATEDDWTCTEVQMDNIDKSQVVSQSATAGSGRGDLLLHLVRREPRARRQAMPRLQHPLLHLRQGRRRPALAGVDEWAAAWCERMTRSDGVMPVGML